MKNKKTLTAHIVFSSNNKTFTMLNRSINFSTIKELKNKISLNLGTNTVENLRRFYGNNNNVKVEVFMSGSTVNLFEKNINLI